MISTLLLKIGGILVACFAIFLSGRRSVNRKANETIRKVKEAAVQEISTEKAKADSAQKEAELLKAAYQCTVSTEKKPEVHVPSSDKEAIMIAVEEIIRGAKERR